MSFMPGRIIRVGLGGASLYRDPGVIQGIEGGVRFTA